VFNRNHNSST